MEDDQWKPSPSGETAPTWILPITVSNQTGLSSSVACTWNSTNRPPSPAGTTRYPITYCVPQNSHFSQGTCGAVAPYSFDQFKKTTNHASKHVMGCAPLPRTLLANLRQLWDGELSTLLTPMATSPTQLSSKWQPVPHTLTLAPITSQRQPQRYSKVGM